MAEKTLQTRLILKHDTIAALNASTFVPKKGEAILAEITVNKQDPVKGTVAVPTYMMKVGDGKSKFSALNWVAAPAADVYDWAKAATKPSYSHEEISGLADAYDAKGAADTALGDAKTYADGKVTDLANGQVAKNKNAIAILNGDADTNGSVAKAASDAQTAAETYAKDYADGLAKNYDASGAASSALSSAKGYTDTLETTKVASNTAAISANKSAIELLNGDASTAGSVKKQIADAKSSAISTAATDATTKANAAQSAAESHADSGDTTTLESANKYTDGKIAALSGTTGSLTTLGNRVSTLETTVGDSKSGLVKKANDNAAAISAEVTRATGAESTLDEKITTNKNAIDKLNGEETTTGSVKAIAKSYADTAYNNASTLVTNLSNGQVKTNKNAIATINGTGTGSISKALQDAKDYADDKISKIPKQTDYTVSVSAGDKTGYAKSYTISQCGNTIGTIDIPKDMVVQSGAVVTNPEGQPAGTYIELTLANATSDKIYVNVGNLIEYVTGAKASDGIITTAVDSNHVLTATIGDGTVTKAKLATAVQTTLGKADNAVQNVTTTANAGLKVTGKAQVDIDDSVVFVLDGGTATTNI